MKNLNKYIKKELKKLENSFVKTPESRQELEEFGELEKGNGRNALLMQMAVQFGYKIAMEEINENFTSDENL
jgi:hypothetical protein